MQHTGMVNEDLLYGILMFLELEIRKYNFTFFWISIQLSRK